MTAFGQESRPHEHGVRGLGDRVEARGGQVAALRAEGLSWREIGRTLGVGVATARAAFQARAENLSESAPVSD